MDVLGNLRYRYHQLCVQIDTAIRTHAGDPHLLRSRAINIAQYSRLAETHSAIWPTEEYGRVRASLTNMLSALQDRSNTCEDPPDYPTGDNPIIRKVYTGKPGRPKWEIHPIFLEDALTLRGPRKIASVVDCSSRTVRRRALELGFREPCPPMLSYVEVEGHDGQVQRILNTATPPMSTLTEEQLDREVQRIARRFPRHGYRMIRGSLLDHGHRVPCPRISESHRRVVGAPQVFGNRPVERRTYWVPGVNSLWHHDGNHDLIRWKIVTHSFIDGKSRFITGIRAHNNNRAETVLNLFLEATESHGWPSRLRGDHGGENVLCADVMEARQGYGRGSYIWGTSPHNSRIERSWLDYHNGVVVKWKPFFHHLEDHRGLDAENEAHIWLLHFLFLPAINRDIHAWQNAWNLHSLNTPEPGQATPREMVLFGLHQHGVRGLRFHVNIDVQREDREHPVAVSTFGVNPADVSMAARARTREAEENRTEVQPRDPFVNPSTPARLSVVICDEPQGPLTVRKLNRFVESLSMQVDGWSEDMAERERVWMKGLELIQRILHEPDPPQYT